MRRKKKGVLITHRQPVIHHTMAMVAPISPGGLQSHHHLVPPPIFAQMLRQICQGAFGQPLELLHYLLSLLHGVETVHPKHNLHLHFQGQHAAKRFVLRIDQPSAVHDDNSVKHGMGSLRAVPPYSWVPGTNHPLAPGLGVPPKKVYPWGAPPRVSSHGQTPPRDVSPPISSSHGVSKSRCALRESSFQFDQLSWPTW